jgi:hypothetical protein
VTWAPEKFRPALAFVASRGAPGREALARSIETIVRNCDEPSDQLLALDALGAIRGDEARRALARLASDLTIAADLRDYSATLLDPATAARGATPGVVGPVLP